ncbi:hypothetical protein XENTR_v10021528 [Xenopus tropicalis]|nr:hypothetical protein XENTR_v10021528 [Xenopus tropicalis]
MVYQSLQLFFLSVFTSTERGTARKISVLLNKLLQPTKLSRTPPCRHSIVAGNRVFEHPIRYACPCSCGVSYIAVLK